MNILVHKFFSLLVCDEGRVNWLRLVCMGVVVFNTALTGLLVLIWAVQQL